MLLDSAALGGEGGLAGLRGSGGEAALQDGGAQGAQDLALGEHGHDGRRGSRVVGFWLSGEVPFRLWWLLGREGGNE